MVTLLRCTYLQIRTAGNHAVPVGVNVERVGDAERDEWPKVLALAVEIVLGHLVQLTHPWIFQL